VQTRQLTREDRPGRQPVLLMLDEFTALGRLDFMHRGIGFFRGYGIRVLHGHSGPVRGSAERDDCGARLQQGSLGTQRKGGRQRVGGRPVSQGNREPMSVEIVEGSSLAGSPG